MEKVQRCEKERGLIKFSNGEWPLCYLISLFELLNWCSSVFNLHSASFAIIYNHPNLKIFSPIYYLVFSLLLSLHIRLSSQISIVIMCERLYLITRTSITVFFYRIILIYNFSIVHTSFLYIFLLTMPLKVKTFYLLK